MTGVLLADDEDMIRTALASLLDLEGDIEVVAQCRDGADARAPATRLVPDVRVLDLGMPILGGVEVANQLRRKVPSNCVIVTQHARPEVSRQASSVGVQGFLPKSRPAADVAEVILGWHRVNGTSTPRSSRTLSAASAAP